MSTDEWQVSYLYKCTVFISSCFRTSNTKTQTINPASFLSSKYLDRRKEWPSDLAAPMNYLVDSCSLVDYGVYMCIFQSVIFL